MKRLAAVGFCVCVVWGLASADTFGTGGNQFTIDFVDISGDASSANGTNISGYSPGQKGYMTFTDPGDYRMGMFEITNDQWDKFKAEYGTVTGNPFFAYDEDPYWTGRNVPTNELSWYEAAQFVNWLNTSTNHLPAYKFSGTQGTANYTLQVWQPGETGYDASNPYRNSNAYYFLPTEDEWVKAAYWNGTSLQTYATKPGDTLHQGDGVSGTGWNYYKNGYATNPYGPWDVGSGSEELNGTYDMMGNEAEWMESPSFSGDYGAGSYRVIRGGAYLDDAWNRLRSSERPGDNPNFQGSVGVRVASIPEPGSAVLMLAGLGFLRKRRG